MMGQGPSDGFFAAPPRYAKPAPDNWIAFRRPSSVCLNRDKAMLGSGKEDDTFEKIPIEDLEKVRRQIQKRLRGQTARQRRARMLSEAAATPRKPGPKPGLSSAFAPPRKPGFSSAFAPPRKPHRPSASAETIRYMHAVPSTDSPPGKRPSASADSLLRAAAAQPPLPLEEAAPGQVIEAPHGGVAWQIARPIAALPARASATLPARASAALPARASAALPAGVDASLPVGPSAALPARANATLPARASVALPAGVDASLSVGPSAALPAGAGHGLSIRPDADLSTRPDADLSTRPCADLEREFRAQFFDPASRLRRWAAPHADLTGLGLEDLLFFDLETTGLSCVPLFLIGALVWDGEALEVRQYFARDYAEERATLSLFHALAAGKRAFVTFNGRSFDVPFLRARAAVHHIPFQEAPVHLDLLHLGRRAWGARFGDCKLQTLERCVCGRRRHGDIPSAEIPEVYHDFVRTGNARLIADVLRHNLQDLLTLAELMVKLPEPARQRRENRGTSWTLGNQ